MQQGQRPQPKPRPFRKTNSKYNLPQIRTARADEKVAECNKKEQEAFDRMLEVYAKQMAAPAALNPSHTPTPTPTTTPTPIPTLPRLVAGYTQTVDPIYGWGWCEPCRKELHGPHTQQYGGNPVPFIS